MALAFFIRIRRGFSVADRASYESRFGTLVCFVGAEIFGMTRGWCAAEFREENIFVSCFCHCLREHPMRQGPLIFETGGHLFRTVRIISS